MARGWVLGKGNALYFARVSGVSEASVSDILAGGFNGDDFPGPAYGTSLTGFAVGTQNAYFAEPGSDSACSQDPATARVPTLLPNGNCRGPNVCPDVSPANQTCNQPNAMSFALDGAHIYWITSRCDISYIADSPH